MQALNVSAYKDFIGFKLNIVFIISSDLVGSRIWDGDQVA